MNDLKIFEHPKFGKIRTIQKDGEPWFVAADVCRALDIKNNRDAMTRLDEDEKGVVSTDTPSGKQEMSIINEPGLYSLVLGSRKPEAKAFKRWITHEVLPSIRRTGAYSLAPATRQLPPEVSPGGLAKLILATRRVMLDAGNSSLDVREATRNIYETWCIPVPPALTKQLPGQLCLFEQLALEH